MKGFLEPSFLSRLGSTPAGLRRPHCRALYPVGFLPHPVYDLHLKENPCTMSSKMEENPVMNKESRKIHELIKRLIKIEEPSPFPTTDPAKVRSYLQQSREPIALLRNLREQLARIGPFKTLDPRVRDKLVEIRKRETPTDRGERYLRRIHLFGLILSILGHQGFDRVFAALGPSEYSQSREDLQHILQDAQLKTELDERFGSANPPDDWWYEFESLQDLMFDVGYDAHKSNFKREKYLDLVREVLAIVAPEQYGERIQSIGTPIVSQTVPSSLEKHLQRLKKCYLLGLNEMTIVSCRSVLEAAFSKVLRQQGKLSGWDKSPPLARMIAWTTAPKLDSKMKRRAHGVRRRARDVLHSEETEEFTEEMALTSVKDTFGIVETLYGQLP